MALAKAQADTGERLRELVAQLGNKGTVRVSIIRDGNGDMKDLIITREG